MIDFSAKPHTVLITGAGSGIGAQLAMAFAAAKALVVVTDLNLASAAQTAQQITASGGQALALALDVSDEAAVATGFQDAVAHFGRIDTVISNAGIQHISAIDQLAYADWQKMMRIHLDGAFLVTREALRYFYPQRSGCLIYFGSIHSKVASPLKAPYVTAKHGLLGLCKAVAKEGAAYNVRSHVICPGFVKTPLVEKQIPEQAKTLGISEDDVVKRVMLGQTVDGAFTSFDELNQLALFLAANDNLVLTGQSLMATHGWHME
jgi:3-hydroxybutyrate dehydrogenase